MAWTKEECEADALRSYEKVIGTEFSVSSLEVFMNIQHHVTSTSTLRWYVAPVKATDGIEEATAHCIFSTRPAGASTRGPSEDGQGNKTHATCKAKI